MPGVLTDASSYDCSYHSPFSVTYRHVSHHSFHSLNEFFTLLPALPIKPNWIQWTLSTAFTLENTPSLSIYNVDRKCKGMLTPERFNILQRAFEKAKYSGLYDNVTHPPASCIRTRRPHHTQRYQHTSQKSKNSISRMLPPHIIIALQKWALVTK